MRLLESFSTVDLLPALVGELRAHRARQAALGIHLVRADALAFTTRTGKPHHQRSALGAVQTAATAANLGHVTAHDLRHSLVANALDAGLTLAEAARLARHASPAVTATVYAYVLEAKRETLGAKLAQAGFGAKEWQRYGNGWREIRGKPGKPSSTYSTVSSRSGAPGGTAGGYARAPRLAR